MPPVHASDYEYEVHDPAEIVSLLNLQRQGMSSLDDLVESINGMADQVNPDDFTPGYPACIWTTTDSGTRQLLLHKPFLTQAQQPNSPFMKGDAS